MKRILIFILACTFIFGIIPTYAQNISEKLEIFVDSNARDGGNGEIDSPFNTLEQVRDYIRKLKKDGNYPKNGVTVNLREGVFSRNEAFVLTKEDSGLENAPVIYKAYNNEEVKIVGGTELKLKDFAVSGDSAIDSTVKGKIYSYNLKVNGIKAYDELPVTGHSAYYLQMLGISKEAPALPVPLYNEEACTLARYPNDDWITVTKVHEPGDAVRHWFDGDKSTDYVPPEQRNDPPLTMKFEISDPRIKNWVNAKDMWANGYWYWDWSDQTTSISKIDADNKILESAYPSAYAVKEGQRFYVYNLLEELDIPGEWYYDTDTGEFYIYPKDSNPESSILLPFSEESLLEISNAEYVNFSGITFSGARKAAITVNECNNILIEYCTVSHVSSSGITVQGGKNVTVSGCHLYDLGEEGIELSGGSDETLEPANHLAINNWIHDFSVILRTYTPGIRLEGVGNRAAYNLIHGSPHTGLVYGGNDHIIEYNEIYDVLKEAADMGAIYTGRSLIRRGTIIRGNLIHDCYSNSNLNDIHAIYFDDTYSGTTVTGNIIYNLPGNGVFINGGRDNTVTNNIFYNLTKFGFTMNCLNRATNWVGNQPPVTERLGLPSGLHKTEPYSKYPHMNNILEDSPADAKYNVFKNNACINVGGEYQISDLQEYGSPVTYDELKAMNDINEGYLSYNVEDAGFVAVENEDFTLREDSKIFEKLPEFENIDAKKAGLITSRLKNELQNNAVALVIGKENAYVNWEKKFIDPDNYDVVPFIEDNYTYVPIRFMSEILGGSVSWYNGVVTIDYNGTELKVKLNSNIATIDGSDVEMNAPALIKNDRIFVPLRDCSQLFGKNVFWDDSGVIIVSDDNKESKFTEEMIAELKNRL